MNKTCGTCKYKGKPITKYDDETFEDVDTGYFQCDLIEHDKLWEYEKGKKALTIDGSGYIATLCVEDDFGCTEWQPPTA